MLCRTRGRPLRWLLAGTLLSVAVAVPGAGPASAAADPIAGSWNVTYGNPAVVTMTLANGVFTETAATPVRVVGAACDLPAGTVIATFSATGPLTYVGQHGLWNVADCSFAFFTPITLTLSADGATLLGRLGNGETVSFTRSAPTPAPSPLPTATCSRSTARSVLLSRHLGNPPEPEGQVLCGHFTGRGSHAMVVSLSTPGCGGSIGWLVFRRHGGPRHGGWRIVLDRPNGARLSAIGRRIRETLPILLPTDPHCLPSGGTRSRTWHWTGHGFVHTRFRRHPATLASPGGGGRTEQAAADRAARLAAAEAATSRPVCTTAAVHRAIARQEHPPYRWALSGLQCAGRYAIVALEDLTDQAEFTRLLHWTSTNRWQLIDRMRACAQGRVPRRIRTLTCQSN